MTRSELQDLPVAEQYKWLMDSGWEVENLGRSLVWKLKSKSGTTTATFSSACEMQLKRDAQKLGTERAAKKILGQKVPDWCRGCLAVANGLECVCPDPSSQKRHNANVDFFEPLKDASESVGDDLVIEEKLLKQIADVRPCPRCGERDHTVCVFANGEGDSVPRPPWTGDNLLRLAFRAGVAWGRFQKTSTLKE